MDPSCLDSLPSNRPPFPLVLPGSIQNDDQLSLTPVKSKSSKVPKKQLAKKKSKASKKVVFVENNYPPSENKLARPTLHTTNLLQKNITRSHQEELDIQEALKEIQLSESFNTAINEEMTCYLNYNLDDKKYTGLIAIADVEKTEQKPMLLVPRKVPRDRKKNQTFKPDPMEFWSNDDFITEQPCTEFDIDFKNEEDKTGSFTASDEYDYLFYIYKKNYFN